MSSEIIAFQASDLPNSLELLFDAAIVINRDGRIINVNGQACYLFGYDMDEMINKELDLLLPERLRENHHRHRKHYFASPASRTMGTGLHLFGRRRDGSEFPIDVGLRPILLENVQHALAVQAVFEQRLATFTSLSISIEKLQQMIETQLSPVGERVLNIEVRIPEINTRIDKIEKDMKDFGNQWEGVKPTFERISHTFEHIDSFAKHAKRVLYIVGGLVATSVITQLVASFFHILNH